MDEHFRKGISDLGASMKATILRGMLRSIINEMGTDDFLEFAIEMDWAKNCFGDDFDQVFRRFATNPNPDWAEAWTEAKKDFILSTPEV